MSSSTIVQKLWNYCNVLRDDGMSYGDYVEQLTYLLFLKMADEHSRPPYNQASPVPAGYYCLPSPRPSPGGRGGLRVTATSCSIIIATRWRNWASRKACSA